MKKYNPKHFVQSCIKHEMEYETLHEETLLSILGIEYDILDDIKYKTKELINSRISKTNVDWEVIKYRLKTIKRVRGTKFYTNHKDIQGMENIRKTIPDNKYIYRNPESLILLKMKRYGRKDIFSDRFKEIQIKYESCGTTSYRAGKVFIYVEEKWNLLNMEEICFRYPPESEVLNNKGYLCSQVIWKD